MTLTKEDYKTMTEIFNESDINDLLRINAEVLNRIHLKYNLEQEKKNNELYFSFNYEVNQDE